MDVKEASQIIAEIGDNPLFYERELQRHEAIYEELIRRAGVKQGSKVLELGTGTGPVAFKLARRIGPKGKVVAIDVNPEMLRVATGKLKRLNFSNVKFMLMNMEEMELPNNAFDHVISSYGVCCCFYYDKALREAYRVLRPGGKLTHVHEGPHEDALSKIFYKIFSKYKTKEPSEKLKKKREAFALQSLMWSKYKDPFEALALMQEIGFKNPEASITHHSTVFPTIEEAIDYELFASLEFEEIAADRKEELQRELATLAKFFVTDEGLVRVEEQVYYSGHK